jgi:hypothetical protein
MKPINIRIADELGIREQQVADGQRPAASL